MMSAALRTMKASNDTHMGPELAGLLGLAANTMPLCRKVMCWPLCRFCGRAEASFQASDVFCASNRPQHIVSLQSGQATKHLGTAS